MAHFTQNDVLSALSKVKDPDLNQDLVSLGMIRDLTLSPAGDVHLRVVLTTPACPLKAKIEADVRNALSTLNGVRQIEIRMDAEVRNKAPSKNRIDGVQNVIAVSSGKGGVGKSTVAANLAVSLALEGARVGLLDADVYGPNMPTMMGVKHPPNVQTDANGRELMVPPQSHGVKVMSMGFLVDDDQPMIWRGPMLHNVINQFCHQVNWGELDYLVVDMPPGTGDVQLSLAQLVPITGAVMVTTPQEVALQDVRKAFRMWEKVRVPVVGIVENMSFFRCGKCNEKHTLFGSGGGESLSKKFGSPLIVEMPIVPEVRAGGDSGRPVVIGDSASETAQLFREAARKIAQQISIAAAEQVDPSQFVQIGKFS